MQSHENASVLAAGVGGITLNNLSYLFCKI
jgi:hypothetical protein